MDILFVIIYWAIEISNNRVLDFTCARDSYWIEQKLQLKHITFFLFPFPFLFYDLHKSYSNTHAYYEYPYRSCCRSSVYWRGTWTQDQSRRKTPRLSPGGRWLRHWWYCSAPEHSRRANFVCRSGTSANSM